MGDAGLQNGTNGISSDDFLQQAFAPLHPLTIEEHAIDDVPSIKAILVGSGITGITAAILLPRKVPGLELTIYERNPEVGGVWYANIYPGVRCDVPAHAYQSSFAPSRDWSTHYAGGAEIKQYWESVVDKFDARKYIQFEHEVLSAVWSDEKAKWIVTVKHGEDTRTDEAEFLISATGRFSKPKLPSYPGMGEYEGHLRHSGNWDPNFDPKDKRIAVIGNGASGLQVLPELQKAAKRIDHYARNPTWVAGSLGAEELDRDKPISDEVKASFQNPEEYHKFRKALEGAFFSRLGSITKDADKNKQARKMFTELMQGKLGDRIDILDAILPQFSPSCRRLTPGPGYLEAIIQDNVDYISTPIERFTKTGIRTVDGVEREVDAVICATGSGVESGLSAPFPIIARGENLQDTWRVGGDPGFPNAYLGFAVAGFPNLVLLNGPNTSPLAGTLNHSVENQVTYIAKILRKVSQQGIRSIEPSKEATNDFIAYCDAFFPRTVFTENCRSWFNGGVKGGRILANWPGSGTHASIVRRDVRWEDWVYTYRSSSRNRFAYFGNGWCKKDVQADGLSDQELKKSDIDLTPHLKLEAVTGELDLRGFLESWYDP